MMNDDVKQFEERLQRQPMKTVPSDWRDGILAAAREAQAPRQAPRSTKRSSLSAISYKLAALLWPHPRAWAGLAAVWVVILALNFAMRERPSVAMAQAAPASPEVLVELRQQHRMLAELLGSAEPRVANRQRSAPAKPHSGRVEISAG